MPGNTAKTEKSSGEPERELLIVDVLSRAGKEQVRRLAKDVANVLKGIMKVCNTKVDFHRMDSLAAKMAGQLETLNGEDGVTFFQALGTAIGDLAYNLEVHEEALRIFLDIFIEAIESNLAERSEIPKGTGE